MDRRRIGIDTSVLVRLVTGLPPEDYSSCVERLAAMTESDVELFASNQVIEEAYVALQHHYGTTREDAKSALRAALTSGLVAPLNGSAVLEALAASSGPGLFDRLIVDDYARSGLTTLTLDREMSSLSGAKRV